MADRVIFVGILILAGFYFYATEQLPSLEIGDPLGPKAFPRLLVVGLLITAGVLLIEMLRGRKPAATTAMGRPKEPETGIGSYLVIAAVSGWMFLYFLVFERLGYLIATPIFLLALMAYFNRGKWVSNVLTAVLFPVGSYVLFTKVLGVTLARGILPF